MSDAEMTFEARSILSIHMKMKISNDETLQIWGKVNCECRTTSSLQEDTRVQINFEASPTLKEFSRNSLPYHELSTEEKVGDNKTPVGLTAPCELKYGLATSHWPQSPTPLPPRPPLIVQYQPEPLLWTPILPSGS